MVKEKIVKVEDISQKQYNGPKGAFTVLRFKTGDYWVGVPNIPANQAVNIGDEVGLLDITAKKTDKGVFYNAKAVRILNSKDDKILEKLDKILKLLGDKEEPNPLVSGIIGDDEIDVPF